MASKRTSATGVAVLGCGIVGAGVISGLLRDRGLIQRRAGVSLELRHVVEKFQDRAKQVGVLMIVKFTAHN